jgi:hypothetical protein
MSGSGRPRSTAVARLIRGCSARPAYRFRARRG